MSSSISFLRADLKVYMGNTKRLPGLCFFLILVRIRNHQTSVCSNSTKKLAMKYLSLAVKTIELWIYSDWFWEKIEHNNDLMFASWSNSKKMFFCILEIEVWLIYRWSSNDILEIFWKQNFYRLIYRWSPRMQLGRAVIKTNGYIEGSHQCWFIWRWRW